MKRSSGWRANFDGANGGSMPLFAARPVVILLAIVAFLLVPSAQGSAEFLPEASSVDAQIIRKTTSQPDLAQGVGEIEARIRAIIPNADDNCLPITEQSLDIESQVRTRAQSDLDTAVRQIQQSETGSWLVQFAAARKVIVCLDHATALEAHYRSHLRLVGLSTRLNEAGRVVFLAHELAHVPQHPHFSNNRRFAPEDMLLLQRVREAAAEAVATRVLWQLREEGISSPWQEKLATAYYDIAKTFETTMAGGEGTVRELWATRSAFHHWFRASWRLEIYDDLMLNTLDRITDDAIGLVPTSKHLSDRFLVGIANYDGQGFLIGGDGRNLIRTFRADTLSVSAQARLDAILAKAESPTLRTTSFPIAGAPLSAVEPISTAVDND